MSYLIACVGHLDNFEAVEDMWSESLFRREKLEYEEKTDSFVDNLVRGCLSEIGSLVRNGYLSGVLLEFHIEVESWKSELDVNPSTTDVAHFGRYRT
jgi:hypothetical protein